MLQQCEAVELTQPLWDTLNQIANYKEWLADRCVTRLVYAVRYKLERWKAACIKVIAAADESVLETQWYTTAKQQWSEAPTTEVEEAKKKKETAAVEGGEGGETHG